MAESEYNNYQGGLKKMQIEAYKDDAFSQRASVNPNPFKAFINPENYTVDIKYEFENAQGQGTTGGHQQFKSKTPEEMSFEFLFDNTGIIDGNVKTNIADDIANFKDFLMGFDGDTHQPRFFKFVWGTDIFKGRCLSLNINYKLFNPDGSPIRAVCKVSLRQAVEEKLRVRQENKKSPDLTHYRIVKKGDTLPLLCYKIYGDSKYYIQVAKVNNLDSFRELEVGDELFFPPINKASKNA